MASAGPSARTHLGDASEAEAGDLASWRAWVAPLFDVEELASPFRGYLAVHRLGELRLMVAAAGGQRMIRCTRDAGDFADQMLVLRCTSGSAEVSVSERSVVLDEGDVTCLDLAEPFSIAANSVESYGLMVPRRLLFAMPGDAALHGRVLPAGLARARALGSHFDMLVAACPSAEAPDGDVFGMLTAALLEAAFIDRVPAQPSARDLDRSRFGEISRYIEANLGDNSLSAEHLCDKFGTSRATLYRMFEQSGGVASFIRNRRLTLADRSLGEEQSSQERISALAARFGFKSEDTFSRSYRERYGQSPRHRRANARTAPTRDRF
jgi:AraC-like DNA-binding protein